MKNKKITSYLAIVALTAGAVLMALGINAGENREIMNKGVDVCLECIGIS